MSARLLFLCLACTAPVVADEAPVRVDFDRQIRPLLSDRCSACHGPDAKSRKAELRLDRHESALAERPKGPAAIVPGDPAASELIRRITHPDPDERMPPANHRRQLAPHEIQLLRTWIAQGAPWSEHWAWLTPERRPPP